MAVTINASTSAGLVQTADTSGVLQLQTNSGTTAVTIDTSQNVGIGTTSPGTKLDVFNSSINASYSPNTPSTWRVAQVRNDQTSTANSAAGIAFVGRSDTQPAGIVAINGNTTGGVVGLGFLTVSGNTTAEAMRIDSSGNVLVGQTTNTYSGKIAMSHDSSVDDGLVIRDTRTTGGSNQVSFIYNTTQVGRIHTTSSATTYATSSDYRLKENVLPMTGALDKVLQLKPVTYTWKQDGSDGQGFIAHELQAVVPDAVVGEKDAIETYTDEYGIEQTRPKYQGIDTSFLVATLTAAIQEQQTIINDLKARIETLEAK